MDFLETKSDKSYSNEKKAQFSTTAGRVIIGITGGIALGLTFVCSSFVSPAFRKYCLPYIPATDQQVKNILIALKGRKGTVLDLGSGDGRIVLEAAKLNFVSHGVELNPWLVLYSRLAAWKNGHSKKTAIFKSDLWKYDVSKYDNIVIFGVEQMMENLGRKFQAECKCDCRIIACRFPLRSKEPIATVGSGIDTVWVYNIDEKK